MGKTKTKDKGINVITVTEAEMLVTLAPEEFEEGEIVDPFYEIIQETQEKAPRKKPRTPEELAAYHDGQAKAYRLQ